MRDLQVVSTPRKATSDGGIVTSARPQGWLGKQWLGALASLGAAHQGRIARGRTFARGGRVQDLWFTPGLVTADVQDQDRHHHVSLRVRIFERIEWNTVLATLVEDVGRVAALMEGSLAPDLVAALADEGVAVVPRLEEVEGDCDCADYLLPCVHMSAVHQLLADALDGDPFLVFVLRGWDREELLLRLRAAWGDDEDDAGAPPVEEAPPGGAWSKSPRALGAVRLDVGEPAAVAIGLRALGPPPDEGDLERALGPLYDAGAEAALRLFWEEDATDLLDRRRKALENRAKGGLRRSRSVEAEIEDPGRALTERLVDALAEVESARTNELAERLGASVEEVRQELVELEELGLVYRTGQTRGTRWWLG